MNETTYFQAVLTAGGSATFLHTARVFDPLWRTLVVGEDADVLVAWKSRSLDHNFWATAWLGQYDKRVVQPCLWGTVILCGVDGGAPTDLDPAVAYDVLTVSRAMYQQFHRPEPA